MPQINEMSWLTSSTYFNLIIVTTMVLINMKLGFYLKKNKNETTLKMFEKLI